MKTPIKLNFKIEAFLILLIVTSFIAGFYFYGKFSDRVVTHWNFNGDPDGYSGKFMGAFMLPIMLAAMYVLFIFLPALDPRKERYNDFQKSYDTMRFGIIAVLFAIYIFSGLYNIGYDISIGKLVPIIIGFLFILIGNMLGKIKSNWFFGIRTPWTLSSENVWNKTHRMGGFMFVIFGILMIVSPFLSLKAGMAAFIVGILLVTVGTTVYSYLLFRAEKKGQGGESL